MAALRPRVILHLSAPEERARVAARLEAEGWDVRVAEDAIRPGTLLRERFVTPYDKIRRHGMRKRER
jgi:hypothetical protein